MGTRRDCSAITKKTRYRWSPASVSTSTVNRSQAVRLSQGACRNVWVANYYSARNPLRLSSLVILGVVARRFRCATRSSCWCT